MFEWSYKFKIYGVRKGPQVTLLGPNIFTCSPFYLQIGFELAL